MVKVSIIVPVYNAELTLQRCIESILSQSFQDFELLLVDDGSIDNTGKICDKYSEIDERVQVFHKKNGGVSSARNFALDYVRGQWVVFVDSDDWVDSVYLEALLAVSYDVDLVIGNAVYVNHPKGGVPDIPVTEYPIEDFNLLFKVGKLCQRTSPWGKLFSYDIIDKNKIRFLEGVHMGEDAIFLYTYLLYSKKIRFYNPRLYFYLYDSGNSLTKRINKTEEEKEALKNLDDSINALVERSGIFDSDVLIEINQLKAFYIHRVLNAIYYNKDTRDYRFMVLRQLDLKFYCQHYLDRHRSLYNNILNLLLRYNILWIYDSIRKLVKWVKY